MGLCLLIASPAVADLPNLSTAEARVEWLNTIYHGADVEHRLTVTNKADLLMNWQVECTALHNGKVLGDTHEVLIDIRPGETVHGRVYLWGGEENYDRLDCRASYWLHE